MLSEEVYWAIIDSSHKTTNQDQELFLVSAIEKLTPQEMIGFRLRTDKLLLTAIQNYGVQLILCGA
jgi:hypothetical protein